MTARPITDYFRDLDKGRFLEEASTALQKVIAGVYDHEKAGDVTLTIKVKPFKAGIVTVCGVVKSNIPTKAPEENIFFVTPESNLSRKDPDQMELEDSLTLVPKANAESA